MEKENSTTSLSKPAQPNYVIIEPAYKPVLSKVRFEPCSAAKKSNK